MASRILMQTDIVIIVVVSGESGIGRFSVNGSVGVDEFVGVLCVKESVRADELAGGNIGDGEEVVVGTVEAAPIAIAKGWFQFEVRRPEKNNNIEGNGCRLVCVLYIILVVCLDVYMSLLWYKHKTSWFGNGGLF